jgi:hypothetical protein
MGHETIGQKRTIRKVLHEFKEGHLKSGRGQKSVRDPKQAIAIALSEARVSRKTTRRR